ncbi:MAG: nuclear transport factor 2 family protein [Ignavibacteriales bacterium]|nr:nuclear transport factor 2 family protein [Ignavibacteriales bacterium]
MRFFVVLCALGLLSSCSQQQETADLASEEAALSKRVENYHAAIAKAYRGVSIDTDSLINEYFAPDVYYVTYWGTSEPIDTTKRRIRSALGNLRDYQSRIENLTVKAYHNSGYAFFIQRQSYTLFGQLMDEYLPTTWVLEKRDGVWKVVHAQRSADIQTITQLMEAAQRRQRQ